MYSNKNILITGASRGIGEQIAKGLANEGYNLFLTSKNEELLKKTSDKIGASKYCACDLSNERDLEKLAKFIEKHSIDILINNAGEYIYGEIEKMDYGQISNIFKTNLLAPTYLCSIAVKNMKQKKMGQDYKYRLNQRCYGRGLCKPLFKLQIRSYRFNKSVSA